MNNRQPGLHWTSSTIFVDVDTGEILTRQQANSIDYLKIKTDEVIKINRIKTRAHIEYTTKVRRNPQGKLDLS